MPASSLARPNGATRECAALVSVRLLAHLENRVRDAVDRPVRDGVLPARGVLGDHVSVFVEAAGVVIAKADVAVTAASITELGEPPVFKSFHDC